jgi:Holliday junction resolvase
MDEKKLQSKVLELLKKNGAYAIKTIRTNKNGVPDIIGCLYGVFFGIEVKSIGNKPKALQNWNIELILSAGGKATTIYNLDDFYKFFDEVTMAAGLSVNNTTKFALMQMKKKHQLSMSRILEYAVSKLTDDELQKLSEQKAQKVEQKL